MDECMLGKLLCILDHESPTFIGAGAGYPEAQSPCSERTDLKQWLIFLSRLSDRSYCERSALIRRPFSRPLIGRGDEPPSARPELAFCLRGATTTRAPSSAPKNRRKRGGSEFVETDGLEIGQQL